MFLLRPIEEDEESYKLLYTFTKNNNPNWKENYLMSFLIQGIELIKQGTMTDYDYFKKLQEIEKRYKTIPSKEYMVILNDIPVVSICITMRNEHIADISFGTDKDHRNKGYTTQALNMIEQMLFQNPNIQFTTIMDYTPDKITSKIALKSGYTFNEDTNYFIKANPNINLENLIERRK